VNPDLEHWIHEALEGRLDEEGRRALAERLGKSPEALEEMVDQLQIHHRLQALLKEKSDPVTEPVLREIRLIPDAERFSTKVVKHLKGERPHALRWRLWGMAAAAGLLALLAGMLFLPKTAPVKDGTASSTRAGVLLVVGDMEEGRDADRLVAERLRHLGYSVTTKRAREAAASDAEGKALVAISSTAWALETLDPTTELEPRFRRVAVPVLTWEPRLFYDLGMTAGHVHGVDWATVRGQRRIAIVRPDHPLAAGLSGTVEIAAAPAQISWGRLQPGAATVAVAEREPEKAVIFAYEAGAVMPGLVAPARRVGFYLFNATAPVLTDAGWKLFDAAVRWCSSSQ